VLRKHERVKEAVVVAREDHHTFNKQLIAYFTTEGIGEPPTQGELRTFLKATLPDFMIPAPFVSLDTMPLTSNGKIDRKSLPAPDLGGMREQAFVPPDTKTQARLASIWKEVLKIENVSIHDDFFMMGGLIWFVAGETGWAGDFASWGMGTREKGSRPVEAFCLGGLVGTGISAVGMLNSWFFRNYAIFVHEVLDNVSTGETTTTGMNMLTSKVTIYYGLSFGIAAGLIVALSPVFQDFKWRLKRLPVPVFLALALCAFVLVTYREGAVKYQLNKKSP